MIVRHNEGQLFHSYIKMIHAARETAHRLDRGKNVHFASDEFRKMAEIMCSLWPNWPWIDDLNPPLKAPSPIRKKNCDYSGNFCKEQYNDYMAPPQWRTTLSIQQFCVYELLTLEINTYMMAIQWI